MKQTLLLNHLWRIALCGCLAIVASSCVNDEYDLDNGISSEANVLGGLTIPIGSIDKITLKDLIDPDSIDMLSIVDGKYVISMSDTLDVEIDELSEDLSITIDGFTKWSDINENIAGDIEFPEVDVNASSQINVKTGLETIIIESTAIVDEGTDFTPSYPDLLKAFATVPTNQRYTDEVNIELAGYDNYQETVNIKIEADCPDFVKTVSGIKFGENGEGVDLTIRFDISAFADACEDISWEYPSLDVDFGEGFVLDNSDGASNRFFEGGNTDQSYHEFTTKIMAYTGEISPDELDNFKFQVQCILGNGSPVVTIKSFTTNGSALNLNAPFELDITSEALEIYDVTLDIDGLELPIEDMDISKEITINDMPSEIESVDRVVFKEGTNTMTIELDRIMVPSGLNTAEEEFLYISFPADRFELSDCNSGLAMTPSADNTYDVPISLDHLIETDGIAGVQNEYILVDAVVLKDYPIEDGSIIFNSGVQLQGVTTSLYGEMTMLKYNEFAVSSATQDIAFSANADDLEVDYAEVTITAQRIPIEDQTTDIDIYEEVPSELAALYTLEFANDVTATINISINGLPMGDDAGELVFDDFNISFPEFIVFADGEVDENNCLNLDGVEIGSVSQETRTFQRILHIESFDFTDQSEYANLIKVEEDGTQYIDLNDAVVMTGDLLLNSGSASSNLDEISGRVEFTLSDVEVGIVSGRLDVDMPEVSESVDLSDLSEELSAGSMSMSMSLTNPMISLEIDNSLPIELAIGTLSIIPYKDGEAKTPLATKETITVAAASATAAEGEYTTTKIVLEAQESSEAGHYQIAGLSSLLNDIPDSLQIEVLSEITGDEHMIDLSRMYDLNLVYDVSVPLEFDDFEISYTDTLSDLSSTLEDVIDYLTAIELQLDITSTLAFSVEISDITAMDASNNVLSLPNMLPSSNTINGSADGSEVASEFDIRISDNDAGDLARLDQLLLTIRAYVPSSDQSVALTEDQYLKVGFKLCLPDGLSIDLDDILGEE